MNIAKDTKIITFHTTKKNKSLLNNYTRSNGTTIKHVMESILTKFLDEQLDKDGAKRG